jgi:tetratricopeptide (TPR) repeat protein
MDKRTPLLVVIGVLLAGLLIGVKFTLSTISDGQSEKAVIEEELKKRDARLSQLGQQIKDLSVEKSLLAEREAELEDKLKSFQDDIMAKTEKEAALNKRADELDKEKQKLSEALVETTGSMQRKLRLTAEEAEQEIERRRREYVAAERKSLVEITVLRKELENLNRDKEMLKVMTAELVDELNQTRQDLVYNKQQEEISLSDDAETEPEEPSPEELFKQHYNQGLVHDSMGDYKQALEEYKQALELMPMDADLHYNMAVIYDDNIKNKQQAAYHYQRYLDLNQHASDRIKVEAWLAKAREDAKWQKRLN